MRAAPQEGPHGPARPAPAGRCARQDDRRRWRPDSAGAPPLPAARRGGPGTWEDPGPTSCSVRPPGAAGSRRGARSYMAGGRRRRGGARGPRPGANGLNGSQGSSRASPAASSSPAAELRERGTGARAAHTTCVAGATDWSLEAGAPGTGARPRASGSGPAPAPWTGSLGVGLPSGRASAHARRADRLRSERDPGRSAGVSASARGTDLLPGKSPRKRCRKG